MEVIESIKDKVNNYTILNIVVATIYVWFYDFIFFNYIVQLFETRYTPMSSGMNQWLFFSGVLPIVFYKGLTKIASTFSLFVYIFAYIPFNETLSVCGYDSEYNDYRIVFLVFMCLFFATDKMTIYTKLFYAPNKISYKKFEKGVFLILFFVVLLNVNNLHFTNFMANRQDLYDLRANLNVVGGSLVIYFLYWLKSILLPLVLVCSLIEKRRKSACIAAFGCILMFMIDQQKITLIAPFVIYGLYMLYNVNERIIRDYYHIIIMGALTIFPLLCYLYMEYSYGLYEMASILIMRTQCIEGMELNTYFNWFGHSGIHPYTYYTHISIINTLTGAYPYDTSLGQVVTNHGANANGMFWLMDGIAAGGIWGCVFISIVFIYIKSLLNGIGEMCKVELFAIFALFALSMTMNVSLFTALLSCGILLAYVLFVKVDFYMLK